MIEINLIPDVKQELLRAQRQRSVVISSSIIVGIVALGLVVALLFVRFGQWGINVATDDGIKKENQTLSSVEDLSEMLTVQHQLATIDGLVDSRTMNSRVFDTLSAVVPVAPYDIRLSDVTLTAENESLNVEGQAQNYDAVEVFKKTLERAVVEYNEDGKTADSPLATDVSIDEIGYGEDASGVKVVRFKLSFTYSEELFSARHDRVDVKLKDLQSGNVTDSYLGVPRSIFAEQPKAIEEGEE